MVVWDSRHLTPGTDLLLYPPEVIHLKCVLVICCCHSFPFRMCVFLHTPSSFGWGGERHLVAPLTTVFHLIWLSAMVNILLLDSNRLWSCCRLVIWLSLCVSSTFFVARLSFVRHTLSFFFPSVISHTRCWCSYPNRYFNVGLSPILILSLHCVVLIVMCVDACVVAPPCVVAYVWLWMSCTYGPRCFSLPLSL